MSSHYFSSFEIKSAGGWVHADSYKVPNQVRLLDDAHSVLGTCFNPVRTKLLSADTFHKIEQAMFAAEHLLEMGNKVITQGVSLLFDSECSRVIEVVKTSPEKWPLLSPFLLRNEPLLQRQIYLNKVLANSPPEATVILACRFLGGFNGAETLKNLIENKGSHGVAAASALATFPPDEVSEFTLRDIHAWSANHPILSIFAEPPAVDQSSLQWSSIEMSFLSEGVTFARRRCSLDFSVAGELDITTEIMRGYFSDAIKARRTQPPGHFPEQELRTELPSLLSTPPLQKKLADISNRQVPMLFSFLGLPVEAVNLRALCLHDRCTTELAVESGKFQEAFLKHMGRWQWVAAQYKNGTAVNDIERAIKQSIQHGESLPVGEVVGQRGNYDSESDDDWSSIDTVVSLQPDTSVYDEIYLNESRAFSASLPSIGIEIQNFTIPENLFYGWKDYLSSHGIRSPWRIEFGSQVEAALPPFYCLENLALIFSSLETTGFFENDTVDAGIHISIGVEPRKEHALIAAAVLLSSPYLFSADQDDEQWLSSLRNLFSKGLVYKNAGTQPVHPDFSYPVAHTELRGISVQGDVSFGAWRDNLFRLLTAVQQWCRIIENIDQDKESAELFFSLQTSMNEVFRKYNLRLLEVDWLIGTGDPFEARTLMDLPIVKALSELRNFFLEKPGDAVLLKQEILKYFLVPFGNSQDNRYSGIRHDSTDYIETNRLM